MSIPICTTEECKGAVTVACLLSAWAGTFVGLMLGFLYARTGKK